MKRVYINQTKNIQPMFVMRLRDISDETVNREIVNRIKNEFEDIVFESSHAFKRNIQYFAINE